MAKVRGRMRRAYGSPRTFPALLGERALLRYTGTAWKARGRRRQLRESQQTRELFGWSTPQALGHAAHGLGVGARADIENHRAADSYQRQAPLGSHRRGGKRLCD